MRKDKSELPRRKFISNISKVGALGLIGGLLPIEANAAVTKFIEEGSLDRHDFMTKPYLQSPSSSSILPYSRSIRLIL